MSTEENGNPKPHFRFKKKRKPASTTSTPPIERKALTGYEALMRQHMAAAQAGR